VLIAKHDSLNCCVIVHSCAKGDVFDTSVKRCKPGASCNNDGSPSTSSGGTGDGGLGGQQLVCEDGYIQHHRKCYKVALLLLN